MLMEDVLEATIASGLRCGTARLNTSRFTASFSVAASITKSVRVEAGVVGAGGDARIAASRCSAVMRERDIWRSMLRAMVPRALSSAPR
jgi:hypothetical protein